MMKTSLQTKLISIGADVGASNGALAVITEDLEILHVAHAPFYTTEVKSKKVKPKLNKETGKFETTFKKYKWTDYRELGNVVKPYLSKNMVYTVEKVGSRRGEGEVNAFIFGNSLGVFQGLYSLINPVSYFEPLPQLWKKELGVTSDKQTSIDLAEKIFNIDLKKLKDGKTDDLAEALLLALYGLKKHLERIGEM